MKDNQCAASHYKICCIFVKDTIIKTGRETVGVHCNLPESWPSFPPWTPGHQLTVSTAPVSVRPAGSSHCIRTVGYQTPGGQPHTSPTWKSSPAHSKRKMKWGYCTLCSCSKQISNASNKFNVQSSLEYTCHVRLSHGL